MAKKVNEVNSGSADNAENKKIDIQACAADGNVGGQAVMEGVMMRSPLRTSIAVRRANGRIVVRNKPNPTYAKKYPFLGWPIIRGMVNFVVMLVSGMKTLTESAEMAGIEMDEEPSKFEKWLADKFGKKAEDVMMGFAVVLAMVLAIGIFFVLPTLLESWIKSGLNGGDTSIALLNWQKVLLNVIGGAVRIALFIGYIALVSRMKEIRRTFQYHGAEHKSVHCFEHGEPLTVENVQKYPTLHPRCGTSFLMIVMVISIIVFLFFGSNDGGPIVRLLSRLALLPLVTGISYEVLRGLARAENSWWVRALKWPGMMMQKLTTAQPDDSMVEVAIAALKSSLDMPDALDGVPVEAEDIAETEATTTTTADTTADSDNSAEQGANESNGDALKPNAAACELPARG